MSWNNSDIVKIWCKGTVVNGYDAANWRLDRYGNWIAFHAYGNRDSPYGWEIDHINPHDGNLLSNLQPLQWMNNVLKSNKRA